MSFVFQQATENYMLLNVDEYHPFAMENCGNENCCEIQDGLQEQYIMGEKSKRIWNSLVRRFYQQEPE